MTDAKKVTAGGIAGLAAVFGSAYASVDWLDAHYAPLAAFEDIQWSTLKEQIRDIRREIRETPDDEDVEGLEEDLEIYIDKLCVDFPHDRECQGDSE